MFINHCQEQQPDQLAMTGFVYSNKMQTSIKVLPFKANNGQDLCMEFKMLKKKKFKKAKEFTKRIKKVHEKTKERVRKR